MALIEPRTLKGFRDYLPEAMIPREGLIDTARRVYRSYGFAPIDTPALEYEEILTGKGGAETDKQLYRFEDHGGRKVALRFDLTIPLARFVAQHLPDIGLPFKRYHIGSVWRGENTQQGRYREFMQCDFDTIGSESLAVDVEAVLVIHDLLRAIGLESFRIRINNRRLLTGLLEHLDLQGRSAAVLRALDKLQKQGEPFVAGELLQQVGTSKSQAEAILKFAMISGDNSSVLQHLETRVHGTEGRRGFEELEELYEAVVAAGIPEQRLLLDVSIARGLDYYTATVFETFLQEMPGIGSVCSGGRYDDLAQLYTKERLPGVGASLGLDRLLTAMEELGMVEKRSATAPVFLPFFDAERRSDYLRLAQRLRGAGIGVEFYPEPKKLGVQLKYADRRGFPVALIVGAQEWADGSAQVKNLATGEVMTGPLEVDGGLNPELVRLFGQP
jgi:histidyl-tRNA synthetase